MKFYIMDTNKKKKRWFRWYFCDRKNALRSFFINYDVRVNLGEEMFKNISSRVKKMGKLHYPDDYISNGWDSLITNKDLFQVIDNSDNEDFYILSGLLSAKNKMKQVRAFLEEFMEMRRKAKAKNGFIILSNRIGGELFDEFRKEFKKKYLKDNINLIIQDKNLEIPVIFGMIIKEKIIRKPYARRPYSETIKKYIESLSEDQKNRLVEIETLVRKLMKKHGVAHFKFEFYRGRGGTLGRCTRDTIKLSIKHCLEDYDMEIKDTILHEIAHAIVGIENMHNKVWKEKAKELGARPSRYGLVILPKKPSHL